MTPARLDDPTLARLRALPHSKQAAASVARIRARSHAALAAAQRRERPPGRFTGRVIDGALVLIGVAYLSGAAAQAWRLFSAIR
jgi:hypothetical protein